MILRKDTKFTAMKLCFAFKLGFVLWLSMVRIALCDSEPGYAPLDYAMLGQQKSGTSTLWMHLRTHPDITCVGTSKETLWFNGDYPRTTLCDNDLDIYQHAVTYARAQRNRTGVRVGDWSATHLSCLCCPVVFKMMNPTIKLLAVLRDPVQRALSRFMEQKVLTFGACHKEVLNETFESYVDKEIGRLQHCRQAATRHGPIDPPQRLGPAAGWGAGMDLASWMAAQCVAKSNILGWSMYDVFLGNYLAHFSQEQVLVLYTDDLLRDPLSVIRRMELFLGVAPGNYSADTLALVYNSRGCYSWQCAKNKADVQQGPATADGSGGPSELWRAGDDRGGWQRAARHEGLLSGTVSRLVDLYRPHMQRLFAWADQGRIAQPPPAWRSRYA